MFCSGGFPLQHSTLTFLPQFDGSFLTCAMSSINQMPSNVSYGQDITQQLLSGQLVTIDLEGGCTTLPNQAFQSTCSLAPDCAFWTDVDTQSLCMQH